MIFALLKAINITASFYMIFYKWPYNVAILHKIVFEMNREIMIFFFFLKHPFQRKDQIMHSRSIQIKNFRNNELVPRTPNTKRV